MVRHSRRQTPSNHETLRRMQYAFGIKIKICELDKAKPRDKVLS
jgi:hypothetical protein